MNFKRFATTIVFVFVLVVTGLLHVFATESAETPEAEVEKTVESQAEIEEVSEYEAEKVTTTKVVKPRSLDSELEKMAAIINKIETKLSSMQASSAERGKQKLVQQFADLEEKLASMKTQNTIVHELSISFSKEGNFHFDAWEKQLSILQNKSLQKRGQTRRSNQLKNFKSLQNRIGEIDKRAVSFKSQLEEILKYLKYDLSSASIKEISRDINRTKKEGENIRKLIDEARKDLERLPVFKRAD